jgi:membrane protein implicated in regulation of membrane protease activity
MRLMFTILLLLATIFLAALLITAYIITPIITWLVANPLAGVALLIIVIVLGAVLIREEVREDREQKTETT